MESGWNLASPSHQCRPFGRPDYDCMLHSRCRWLSVARKGFRPQLKALAGRWGVRHGRSLSSAISLLRLPSARTISDKVSLALLPRTLAAHGLIFQARASDIRPIIMSH